MAGNGSDFYAANGYLDGRFCVGSAISGNGWLFPETITPPAEILIEHNSALNRSHGRDPGGARLVLRRSLLQSRLHRHGRRYWRLR